MLHSVGDTYCGSCGTILDEPELQANYHYEPNFQMHGNYFSHSAESPSSRFNNQWSRERLREAHSLISSYTSRLELQDITERAQRIFDDYIHKRMEEKCVWAFGSILEVRAGACVFVAAQAAGRQLFLVQISRLIGCNVFVIGREVKQIIRMLDTLKGLLAEVDKIDPTLQAETTVNRVFGYVNKTKQDSKFSDDVLQLTMGVGKTVRAFPRQLLDFMQHNESLRPRMVATTALEMEFFRQCGLSTGINLNTQLCTAVSLAIEYYYKVDSAESCTLRRGHRDVIYKLVALPNGTSPITTARFAARVHKKLLEAGKTVPWLTKDVSIDTATGHLEDILFCCQQAQAWMFGVGRLQQLKYRVSPSASDNGDLADVRLHIPNVVSALSTAPAFAQAELLRQRREAILDRVDQDLIAIEESDGTTSLDTTNNAKSKANAELEIEKRETRVLKRLQRLNVIDRNALLSLPLHTLESILEAASIPRKDGLELDTPTVGPKDMTNEELSAYLY
ncbi:hypothetical protein IWW36_003912 [Coemansia brasiliensis]|uniref:Uncharacterized protein n=1 Tax=Coemansia brasiliensis TaxID=2650707 RepID=A0A9W8IAP8_9FUNG|nr:hypothetical protein IWW36_003912 [Coemansia brasiliensis]